VTFRKDHELLTNAKLNNHLNTARWISSVFCHRRAMWFRGQAALRLGERPGDKAAVATSRWGNRSDQGNRTTLWSHIRTVKTHR